MNIGKLIRSGIQKNMAPSACLMQVQCIKNYKETDNKKLKLGMVTLMLPTKSMNEMYQTLTGSIPQTSYSEIRTKTPCHQLGMTLIEIMIALLIGAFLTAGIIQVFIGSKQSYRMTEGQSRLQENARFAIDLMAQDIRMAGFRGCNSQTAITNHLNTPTSFLYSFNTPLQGFESTSSTAWTPAIDAGITSPLGGSDVITIRKAEGEGYVVTAHATGTDDVTLANTTGLAVGDLVVASTCEAGGDVFEITSITGNVLAHSATATPAPGNATQPLSKSYTNGQVYPINTISYYVRTSNGQPSLYRRIGANAAQELVEGIEQLQILYGEDTADAGSTPDYYVPANSVVDMANVVSIRISLLAQTIDDNLTSQAQSYTYNGATTTPTDRKIRRVFNATIALRNRLL